MQYKRYGKGFIKDLWMEYLLVGVVMIEFSALSLSLVKWDIPKPLAARAGEIMGRMLPIIFILMMAYWLLFRRIYTERFYFVGNMIITKREGTIVIPHQAIIIITPAYVERQGRYGTVRRPFKGKYAATIVSEEFEKAAQLLHHSPTRMNNAVDWMLDRYFTPQQMLYGFVCDQALFDKLLDTGKHIVIVPEALKDVFKIDPSKAQVFIDKGDWTWTK